MVVHRDRLIVFGGFYDNGRDVRYYNDLWAFDIGELKWAPLGGPPGGQAPSPRSACQLALHGDVLFLYGGYSKAADEAAADIEHGTAHEDMWALDLRTYAVRQRRRRRRQKCAGPAAPGCVAEGVLVGPARASAGAKCAQAAGIPPALSSIAARSCSFLRFPSSNRTRSQWERVKKAGMAPGPRASFSMATHRGRAFLFGGVSDNEARAGEDLSSDFHNDLFTFNFEKRRWFATELRPAVKGAAAAAGAGADAEATEAGTVGGAAAGISRETAALVAAGRGDAGSAAHRAAVRIQAHFRGFVVRKAYKLYRIGGAVSEILYSPAAFGLDMSAASAPKPRARISAQARRLLLPPLRPQQR
jgi:hypothetical protein